MRFQSPGGQKPEELLQRRCALKGLGITILCTRSWESGRETKPGSDSVEPPAMLFIFSMHPKAPAILAAHYKSSQCPGEREASASMAEVSARDHPLPVVRSPCVTPWLVVRAAIVNQPQRRIAVSSTLRMWPAAESTGRSERVRVHDPAVHHHQASLPKIPNILRRVSFY